MRKKIKIIKVHCFQLCYPLLSLVEFAYNNTPSASTSISPFFTNKGYHLNITVHSECNIASF